MELRTAAPIPQNLITKFAAIVGADHCLSEPDQLVTYECDALTSFHARPGLVVLPNSTAEVVEVVKLARKVGLPIVPRGSGTGLSGGALPVPGCILLGLSRMKRIIEIDFDNQFVRVEPGVINLEITRRIAPNGYYYAPDPSSQQVCTIGGNVAENSGGAWPDVGAALLMDVDGTVAEVEHTASEATELARKAGAIEIRIPRDAAERETMWRGRKSAFAAVGRISPNYVVQDGVIPRSEIASVLQEVARLSNESGLRIANVFHAGDGNLHPLVLYDAAVPGQEALAEKTAGQILKLCVRIGGSITGEHGVGADKAAYMADMFSEDDLATMNLVRCSFDPDMRFNPGKVFPTPRLCGDKSRRGVGTGFSPSGAG